MIIFRFRRFTLLTLVNPCFTSLDCLRAVDYVATETYHFPQIEASSGVLLGVIRLGGCTGVGHLRKIATLIGPRLNLAVSANARMEGCTYYRYARVCARACV